MNSILQTMRTLIIDHLAATESLTADLALGGTVISVPNTSRFRVNDEIYIISDTVGFAETSIIKDIPDSTTIIIDPPSVRGWLVSENTYVQKAVNHQCIKRVHIGDLKVIPSFPTITIDINGETNEWYTLRRTSHDYKFAIRVYVMADNFETTNIFLVKLTQQIREVLLDHIRPIVDGDSHLLTADVPVNATIINIADTSEFKVGGAVFLRDLHPAPHHQEAYVKAILSPTALEIGHPTEFDYLVSRGAELIRVDRLLYDSRPDQINYGYVKSPGGGPLMRAAEISWFAKEMITRDGVINT